MRVRVLGVDPGLTRCGLGVVDGGKGRAVRCVAVGVVRTPADARSDLAATSSRKDLPASVALVTAVRSTSRGERSGVAPARRRVDSAHRASAEAALMVRDGSPKVGMPAAESVFAG